MLVELHSNPIKYIEVHDFLDEATLARWATTLARMPLSEGDVVSPSNRTLVSPHKKNKNAWLGAPNDLALEFRDRAWGQPIRKALLDMNDYLFKAHATIDEGSFLYSKYEQGDYYQWHRDRTPYLTYNLVIKSADEGGLFQFSESPTEPHSAVETVENKSNTLIIFPSFLLHQVTPVWAGERLTLQYFQNSSLIQST